MVNRGVVYIAYGEAARREAAMGIRTLKALHPTLPVSVVGEAVEGARHIPFEVQPSPVRSSRRAKVHLDSLTPYRETLYLDADTRIRGDLSAGFEMLSDGWDICIAPSQQQADNALWHIDMVERETTLDGLGFTPVQWQAGVFFFRQSAAVTRLFALWRCEWEQWQGQDQGALLRALYAAPLRVWALGGVYNGGAVVSHLFGKAKA